MRNLIGVFVFFAALLSDRTWAAQELFLFGGGPRPPEALMEFVRSSGGGAAHILIVAWASADPAGTAAGLQDELRRAGAPTVEVSAAPPLANLEMATGLFFSGGDQLRLLEALTPALRTLILRRWAQGMALAGTSAGTAALSERAFTGREDPAKFDPASIELVSGLGVLPGVILDQHFIQRQRENRLLSAVERYPGSLGVGINEGMALAVSAQGQAKVYGPTQVMFVQGNSAHFDLILLHSGQCWDFRVRQTTDCPKTF